MDNLPTKASLAAHSEMVKERKEHQPVFLFTKDNMGADKNITLVIIPPVRFIGVPTSQVKKMKHTGILVPINISICDHPGRDTSGGGFG